MNFLKKLFGGSQNTSAPEQSQNESSAQPPRPQYREITHLPLALLRNALSGIRRSEVFRALITSFNGDTFKLAEDLARQLAGIWSEFESKCGALISAKAKIQSIMINFKPEEVMAKLNEALAEAEKSCSKAANEVIRGFQKARAGFRKRREELRADEAQAQDELSDLTFRMTGRTDAVINIGSRPKIIAALLLTGVALFLVEVKMGIPQINDVLNYVVAVLFAVVGGLALIVFGEVKGITDRVIEHHNKLLAEFHARFPKGTNNPYARIDDETGRIVRMDPLPQSIYTENDVATKWFSRICFGILGIRFAIVAIQLASRSEVDWMGALAAVLIVLSAYLGSFLVYTIAPRYTKEALDEYDRLSNTLNAIRMSQSALDQEETEADLDKKLRDGLNKVEADYDKAVKAMIEAARSEFGSAQNALEDFKRLLAEYNTAWDELSSVFSPGYGFLVIKIGERKNAPIDEANLPDKDELAQIFGDEMLQDSEFTDTTFVTKVDEFSIPAFASPTIKLATAIINDVRTTLGVEARENNELVPKPALTAEFHRKNRAILERKF